MFKRWLNSWRLTNSRKRSADKLLSGAQRNEDYQPVNLHVAGVMFEHRDRNAAKLRIREKVFLSREPTNIHDKNAILVKRLNGRRLGYINKEMAKKLAPYMDSGNDPVNARVTEITSNLSGSLIGVSVCFYLPPDWHARINEQPAGEDFDYFCDISRAGRIYLNINCDEVELENICLKLTENNLSWIRNGMCYRPASNGHEYKWYIRFQDGISREVSDSFFRDTLGLLSAQERQDELINKYIDLNEDELESCKRVESVHGFCERHFSSGQKDDGRLYFKHIDGIWKVLVSFKESQRIDVEFLKKY